MIPKLKYYDRQYPGIAIYTTTKIKPLCTYTSKLITQHCRPAAVVFNSFTFLLLLLLRPLILGNKHHVQCQREAESKAQ